MRRHSPLLFLVLLLAACSGGGQPAEIGGTTMGTTYSVRYFGTPTTSDSDVTAAIDARLNELETALSTYRSDSEVSRFNAFRGSDWFPVSADTVTIVRAAQTISAQSDGAFDITISPLVELWGFGANQNRLQPPPEDAIQLLLASSGYEWLEQRIEPPALRKQLPALAIDLSAIAKGYAVDEIGELLNISGIESWLVEIGGEIKTKGIKRDGSPWRVAIEKPIAGSREVQQVLPLDGAALATSGDYRNYFEYAGKRYSHSIDPETGWPVADRVGSVSVITSSAMLADAWATALLVTGDSRALELANKHGLALSLTLREPDGELRRSTNAAFDAIAAAGASTNGSKP